MAKTVQPVDLHVGRKMRERRILCKLSQGRLGDLIGVSFQQIQKYEKGANRVGASRLLQIADALEVPASFFFDDIPSARSISRLPGADGAAGFAITRESVELVRAFNAIPDRATRRRIVQLVRTIADSTARAAESAA